MDAVLNKYPSASERFSGAEVKKTTLVYQKGFVTGGGNEANSRYIDLLDSSPGKTCLDIGSGLGGNAIQMATQYGLLVDGYDLSPSYIEKCNERLSNEKISGVSFTLRDVTKEKIEKKYDFAYSRDAIMYMTFEGKEKMFINVFEALRPGAKAVFIDFCGPSGDETEEFKVFCKQRGYFCYSVFDEAKLLEKVGFKNVRAENIGLKFHRLCREEYDLFLEKNKETFITEFGEEAFDVLDAGWKQKIKLLEEGQLVSGLLTAEKI